VTQIIPATLNGASPEVLRASSGVERGQLSLWVIFGRIKALLQSAAEQEVDPGARSEPRRIKFPFRRVWIALRYRRRSGRTTHLDFRKPLKIGILTAEGFNTRHWHLPCTSQGRDL